MLEWFAQAAHVVSAPAYGCLEPFVDVVLSVRLWGLDVEDPFVLGDALAKLTVEDPGSLRAERVGSGWRLTASATCSAPSRLRAPERVADRLSKLAARRVASRLVPARCGWSAPAGRPHPGP